MFQNLHISKLFYIFVKTKEVITIKNKKSMSIFDYTTTRHFVIVNGKKNKLYLQSLSKLTL